MIPEEILRIYNMTTLEEYKALFGDTDATEITFYETFLKQTDYICCKIIEGVSTWEDYADEKTYRQFARTEIEKLLK